MRRAFLALAAGLGILAGCSGTGHSSAAPTSSDVSSTTALVRPTTVAPNPDVVPQSITPAYVNAVFAVLNHINGDAVRTLLAADSMTPSVESDLRSIYGDPLYGVEVKVFEAGLSQGRSNLRNPVGDRRTVVRQLLSAGPQCIFAETTSDLSAVEIKPTAAPASEYWELRLKTPAQDPENINPTPWSLSFNQDFKTPTTMPSPC